MPAYHLIVVALWLAACPAAAATPAARWKHLSSSRGELPLPNGGKQQTAVVVFDIDGDRVNDIVVAERTQAPAVIWLQRTARGWTKFVIDDTQQRPEAGGAAFDLDADGDLDLVLGGDSRSNEVWWYENPAPEFHPATPWKRHFIKRSGAAQHHDQVFGDFRQTGRAQLAFWNQGAKTIFLAELPANPRSAGEWPRTSIFAGAAGESGAHAAKYAEGMAAFDVDGDGRQDLLAGVFWFKYSEGKFTPVRVAETGGRIVAGKFKRGRVAQIVIAPGDGNGPLKFFECTGDPADARAWAGRDLAGRDLVHGHSLEIADINRDGFLDIFAAEMTKWTEARPTPDHPDATAWIFYGDGRGNFTKTQFAQGMGFHEARVADLDGDGKPDVLSKPYHWEAPRLDIWLNQGNQNQR